MDLSFFDRLTVVIRASSAPVRSDHGSTNRG